MLVSAFQAAAPAAGFAALNSSPDRSSFGRKTVSGSREHRHDSHGIPSFSGLPALSK
jgi:hypothetical protein